MKSITLEEYQQHFGEPQAMFASLCSLIRDIIINEPLISRREINQRILDVLSPFAVDQEDTKKKIGEFVDLLKSLHEITELHRNSQSSVFLAVRPQWIKLDEKNAVLLGNFADDDLTVRQIDGYDVVRRFTPDENTDIILCNVPQTEIDDFCISEICEGVQIDSFSKLPNIIQNLWNKKKEELREQVSELLNGDIAVVVGKNGNFFGDYRELAGRWQKLMRADSGKIYFGVMTGRRPDETRWLLIEKGGDTEMRCLQLHDREQWRWLFFQNEGNDFCSIENGIIRFSIPLPQTFELWLHLFASKQPPWGQWRYIIDDSSEMERVLRIFV